MNHIQKYIVIAIVNNIAYMVNMEADSHYRAEHNILDLGYCGRHEYGVETAQAFDSKDMKTDTFIAMALSSNTVSLQEIVDIVTERNKRIVAKEKAEERIHQIEKQMKQLSEELEDAKRILAG